jgi:hypothetical protein
MSYQKVKSASALEVVDTSQTKFYHLTIGGPETGWVIVTDDDWPPDSKIAWSSLFDAMRKLFELNDPRVNEILKEGRITLRPPTEEDSP